MQKSNEQNRIILIDKPKGWTSFDVVAKIRSIVSQKEGRKIKVGHAGTLDPFATGLLVVLVGNETKNQEHYMKKDKEYLATLKFGYTSSTGDPEGDIKKNSATQITRDKIENTLKKFLGEINQIPPKHSAIKINGKRAYQLAREGHDFELKPRQVTIHKLEILDFKWPILKIKISCSSGTYIRTLAEDIGTELKVGAYLVELRRTKVGDFNISDAFKIEEVGEKI
jgi:tRNA pseudouridine55 synthase